MPEWLVQILIQYPIVVVIGFVAWYAYGELKAAHASRLKREEENHAAAVNEQKEFQRQLQQAKDAEIAGLRDQLQREKDELRKEIERLVKVVNELKKRFDA